VGFYVAGRADVLQCFRMPTTITERVTIDPNVCHGKPTIRGLRYPVEMLLGLLAAGMSSDDILADYEDLEREDILAALNYATRLSQVKHVELVAA